LRKPAQAGFFFLLNRGLRYPNIFRGCRAINKN
jgi:hypothetical protein